MRMIIAIRAALFFTCASACADRRLVTPNPVEITDSAMCDIACSRLQQLECAEGKPVPTGVACTADWNCSAGEQCVERVCTTTCAQFCFDVQAAGVWLDPTCVAAISSCDAIDACPLSRPRNE